MNVLVLGPDHPRLRSFLQSFDDLVDFTEEKVALTHPKIANAQFIISYRYRYIVPRDVLDRFPRKAINLHISYLPWNKGADPNMWSFLDDTPKGVTIHYMSPKLDDGPILAQREIQFSGSETLRQSYEMLIRTIEDLFQEKWALIREDQLSGIPQPTGGSYHCVEDKKPYESLLTKGWDTPVAALKGRSLSSRIKP